MRTLLDFYFVGNRTEALAALSYLYPSYSLKRSLLKVLNALNQIGPRVLPKNLSLHGAAVKSLPVIGCNATRAFLLHKVEQKGRLYVFDRNDNGKFVEITKIALNEDAAKGIRREATTLAMLEGQTPFSIPKLLSFETWEGGCALRTTAVSSEQKAYDKRLPLPDYIFSAVAELRSFTLPKTLSANEIAGWKTALLRTRVSSIYNVAKEIRSTKNFAVTAAHRDMGSENIFCHYRANAITDFTLIDWEFFTDTAPALTDQVSVWLGCRHREIKGWRKVNVETLAKKFLSDFVNASGGQDAAVIALLHLADLGIDLAQVLIGDFGEAV